MSFIALLLLLLLICLVTVGLGLIEIFLIPGVGFLGFLSAAAFLGTIAYLFWIGAWVPLVLFLVVSVVLFLLGFYFFSRSRWMDKVSLHKTINEKAVTLPEELVVGAEGTAESRLALSGRVRIGGIDFEATSDAGLIDEHTPIVITRIDRDKVYVRPL